MELRVSDLVVARGGVAILDGVTFTLRRGQALLLRGPNGAGKTTLLRTIAGLQPPLSGILSAPAESVAYAGHADGTKATLTVAENLSFWAAIYGAARIGPALDAFDLAPLARRPARDLSAGQRRRLGLARLLLTGRPLWVLDEPTVSLDAASTRRFAGAVEDHLAAGGIALIATHVDLGLDAPALDLGPLRARGAGQGAFDEAFL